MVGCFFLFIFSGYVVFQWMSNEASPIYAVSRWIVAMETGDYSTARDLSLWNGRSPTLKEMETLSRSLQAYPVWKEKIYRQLEKEAYLLSRGEEAYFRWFQVIRPPFSLQMKVKIPALYLQAEGEDWQNTRLTFLLESGDSSQELPSFPNGKVYGPLLPVQQQIKMEERSKWGLLSEIRHLGYEQMWGENLLSLLPVTPVSSFVVKTDQKGAVLFVDGKKAGQVKGALEVGPLPYEPHLLELRKEYPWGKVQSSPHLIRPGEKEIFLTFDPIIRSLRDILGKTIRDYLDGWMKAAGEGNPAFLKRTEEGFRHIIGEEIVAAKPNRLEGEFIQIILYPASITLSERDGGEYGATVAGMEEYEEPRWVSPEGKLVKALPERSGWNYFLRYTPATGWQVVDTAPLSEDEKKQWTSVNREKGDLLFFHSLSYLNLGTDAGYPPFESWQEGMMAGFDVEFLERLALRTGIRIKLTDTAYHRILEEMRTGGMDGVIAGIERSSLKGEKEFLVSLPYLTLEEKALISNPAFKDPDGEKKVKSIGLLEDSPSIPFVEKWGKEKKGRRWVTYPSIEEGIKGLQEGKIDLLLTDPDLLLPEEKGYGEIYSWQELPKKEYVILLRPGLEEILSLLNQGIEEVKRETSTNSFLKMKYFRPQSVPTSVEK